MIFLSLKQFLVHFCLYQAVLPGCISSPQRPECFTLCLHRPVDDHCLELSLLCQLCQFFLSDHLTYFSFTSLMEIGTSFEKHSNRFPPVNIVSNTCLLLLMAPCLLQNNAIYDIIELFTFSHGIFNQDEKC